MSVNKMNKNSFSFLDLIPAFSGLVGKVALVSSFALVWATELGITYEDFVFENVRLELLIGGFITLLAALFYKDAAPAGTLSPLVVMIPLMVQLGVHPFILGLEIGIIGIITIRSGIFVKLIHFALDITKTSVTLAFGIAGIWLSGRKLFNFFENKTVFFILLIVLSLCYCLFYFTNKNWLMIPGAALLALLIPFLFGLSPEISHHTLAVHIQPEYWWKTIWKLGYGFDMLTIIKTLPFALFTILLWSLDTISIQEVWKTQFPDGKGSAVHIEKSFYIVALRNILGVSMGGAQTSSLWRSYLIPLFMVKRPMRNSAILLGMIGIITSFFSAPIQLMSFVPLVWSVLLFGIFMPFTVAAMKKLLREKNGNNRLAILLCTAIGVWINPIITWVLAVLYERLVSPRINQSKKS